MDLLLGKQYETYENTKLMKTLSNKCPSVSALHYLSCIFFSTTYPGFLKLIKVKIGIAQRRKKNTSMPLESKSFYIKNGD